MVFTEINNPDFPLIFGVETRRQGICDVENLPTGALMYTIIRIVYIYIILKKK